MSGAGGGAAIPASSARRSFGLGYVDLFMRRAFSTRSVAQQARTQGTHRQGSQKLGGARPADALSHTAQMERLSSPSGVQLAKVLGPFDLVMLGIGGIIGAGVFVLTGVAARQHAGYPQCSRPGSRPSASTLPSEIMNHRNINSPICTGLR